MRFPASLLIVALLGARVSADDLPTELDKAAKEKIVIATVFEEPVYLEQVTPASAEGKRKELPPGEFEEWLRKYRGRRTYEIIWLKTLNRYMEREEIGITEEEFASITTSVERRMKSAAELPNGTSLTPEERKGLMVAWSRATLMDWKVCKSLYEKYGGRVGIGSLGAWVAFDGQNALMGEHYKAGDLKFHHKEMEEEFWQQTKKNNFADAYPKGERLERLLATPPYLQN